MSLLRVIICILCPPLAVLDKGCGSVLLVFFLCLIGVVPGIIAALIICKLDEVATLQDEQVHRPNNRSAKDDTIDIEAKEL